ncbi:MAG: uncharacterized protein KVP18_001456 [Porospora cf. gigantea A]|uniref:uncharacterized protein n=2 Tax=Porospora cf. gigantea A TaxID=2853593 RepID=UPI00355A875B|nr:MAG: hypothetical protein KVP18_001456 [Porospora cf. gigantea A]
MFYTRRVLANTYYRYEPVVMLFSWFWLNVGITIAVKLSFREDKFEFPMAMTCIHMVFTFAGVKLSQALGFFTPAPRPSTEALTKIFFFSFLYTVNIWLSNASILAVSLTINQVMRSTVPLFTLIIGSVAFRERYSWKVVPPVLVVILGVLFTIKGDVDVLTVAGFALVLMACAASSLKGIVSRKAQVSNGLTAMDLLLYMCPLAVVQLTIFAAATGELQTMLNDQAIMNNSSLWIRLSLLGVTAFLVNVTSFKSVVLSSPLTMNVLANLKQVLTSLISIWIFGGIVTPALTLGIFTTSIGAFWYSQTARANPASLDVKRQEELDEEEGIEISLEADTKSLEAQ